MKHLEPIAFTTELGNMYDQSRKAGSGTVSVTMKRMTEGRVTMTNKIHKDMSEEEAKRLKSATGEYPCLVRASFRNSKISTVVAVDDLDRFHDAYTTVVKAYMDSLKKKERNKKKKTKSTA